MKSFIEDYPDHEFFFILGSDLLPGLRSWDEGELLVSDINFLIFIRIGFQIDQSLLPEHYIIVNTTFVASSSTEVRKRIKLHCEMHHDHEEDAKPAPKYLDKDEKVDLDQSIDQDSSFANMLGIDHGLKLVNTTDSGSNHLVHMNNGVVSLEEQYLGLFGIVPVSIINYIKKNHLYCVRGKYSH
jgi:hypothetical protein